MSSLFSFLQRGFSLAAETVVMTDKSFCCRSPRNYLRMIVGSASILRINRPRMGMDR